MAVLSDMNFFEKKILSIVQKNLGEDYKQSKNKFYRFYDDFFNIVEIQFLRIGDEYCFTFYFGSVVPKIFTLLWEDKYKDFDYKKLSARNGVFNCNINDVISEFKGKPKIKYWDSKIDELLFKEIDFELRNKMIPFIRRFDSLEHISELIDQTNYPYKESIDIPIMNLALKFLLNKNEVFFSLASNIKSSNSHFAALVDKLVSKKTFE